MACNPDFIDNCKTDKIKDFLQYVLITQYFITEKVDFKNKTKFEKGLRPVMQKFEFFN